MGYLSLKTATIGTSLLLLVRHVSAAQGIKGGEKEGGSGRRGGGSEGSEADESQKATDRARARARGTRAGYITENTGKMRILKPQLRRIVRWLLLCRCQRLSRFSPARTTTATRRDARGDGLGGGGERGRVSARMRMTGWRDKQSSSRICFFCFSSSRLGRATRGFPEPATRCGLGRHL